VADTIAISGAGGALGRLVAERALQDPPAGGVILTTRVPEALEELRRRGAQVRHADFDVPATLPAALAGATRLLLISASTAGGDRVAQHGAAIAVARDAGVRHIVFTSMPRVDDPAHPLVEPAAEYLGTERLLAAAGIDWTILRNGPYAELNLVERLSDSVVDGALLTNAGTGGLAFVSRADCAAVAHAALTSAGHAGRTYDVTGPVAVSYDEVARELSELLGTAIGFTPVDDAAMARRLRDGGVPEALVGLRVAMGAAIREGFFAGTTATVERLTGRPPATVGAVLAGHRGALADLFAVPPR
jgi:NAD(P)H dehydrogenase (quinone)